LAKGSEHVESFGNASQKPNATQPWGGQDEVKMMFPALTSRGELFRSDFHTD